MAIDPSQITTVQVSELPPNDITNESLLAHQVGDILSKATVQQLVAFLQSQSISFQYEIKYIRPPGNGSSYINENFDMTPGPNQGLGKVGGLWEGWQICNGNNGTDNLDGQVLMGYGANHSVIGQFLGSKDAVLVSHTHTTTPNTNINFGSGSTIRNRASAVVEGTGLPIDVSISTVGESGTGKNIQPSMVILAIMKI